ncbi:MAG TPA: amidohydrolase family protein [Burkholderiales bacterium]|nr:amidohydrolase family protein [Burkholderiales bacterium]
MVWQSEPPFAAEALTLPAFDLPAAACDAHAHVFGPAARYPCVPEARYSHPAHSGPENYARVRQRLRTPRAVLVQPSYYRFDNRCLLDALCTDTTNLRGVAMIDPEGRLPELADWHRRGVRGLRVDLFREQALGRSLAQVSAALAKLADLAAAQGWSVDLYAPGMLVAALVDHLAALPSPVSIAHLGYFHPDTDEAALFDAFVERAARSRNLWIKLTGSYRLASPAAQHRVDDMARTLVAAMPERLLWGSDWPHVLADPTDTGVLLARMDVWCADVRLRNRILAENPSRLYWAAET